MSNKNNSGFCIVPFTNLYVANDRIRLCCESEEKTNHRLNNTTGIMDIWNNDFYQSIRRGMLDGELPSSCRKCRLQESSGEESKRLWENNHNPDIDKFNTITNAGPRKFDIRPSNKCNLECVMCNGIVSSAITKRVREYTGGNYSMFPIMTVGDWDQSIYITEYIKKNAENVSLITLAGGEPFLMPEVYDLLESLSKSGHAEHIELRILTNGTVIRERWFEDHLVKFKKVKINVSIDGTGSVLEYVRWPTNWNKIRSNILFLKNLVSNDGRFQLSLGPCLHLMNALNIHELVRFAHAHDLDIALSKVFNNSEETWITTDLLSPELKEKAVSDFKSALSDCPGVSMNLGKGYMFDLENGGYDPDPKQLAHLQTMVKYWDSHRPVKFLEQFPHLAYLITDSKT
jgi:molybdenum cofactor biosynthesis enzyme MoaA